MKQVEIPVVVGDFLRTGDEDVGTCCGGTDSPLVVLEGGVGVEGGRGEVLLLLLFTIPLLLEFPASENQGADGQCTFMSLPCN